MPYPSYGAAAVLCWSSHEEIPHTQGKRNPSKMIGVSRGHQRADTLKPYSQKTSQSNHTRTTALSNSMKLSHACRAIQDRRIMVERSEKSYSTFQVRRGSSEEISLVQSKEQQLCFAGAAMKTYPTSKVRETQVRQ